MAATKVGIAVKCVVCHKNKAPRGRSVPDLTYGSWCQGDICSGWAAWPYPGDLWPGEMNEEFGYDCSDNATRKL